MWMQKSAKWYERTNSFFVFNPQIGLYKKYWCVDLLMHKVEQIFVKDAYGFIFSQILCKPNFYNTLSYH